MARLPQHLRCRGRQLDDVVAYSLSQLGVNQWAVCCAAPCLASGVKDTPTECMLSDLDWASLLTNMVSSSWKGAPISRSYQIPAFIACQAKTLHDARMQMSEKWQELWSLRVCRQLHDVGAVGCGGWLKGSKGGGPASQTVIRHAPSAHHTCIHKSPTHYPVQAVLASPPPYCFTQHHGITPWLIN